MRFANLCLGLCYVALAACGGASAAQLPTLAPTRALVPTQALAATWPPTWTPAPTASPFPTRTRTPTFTPTATATATPSATPTFLTTTPWPLPAPTVIGYSVLGRPLEVYALGTGPRYRLIVAGIHGGSEYNTIALADQLMQHLLRHPETVPPDLTLLILRVHNPDGEQRAHSIYGRANENNVDLNRNYPAGWRAELDRTGCWNYLTLSPGAEPGSEPETQAVMNLVQAQPLEALLSYHSAALGIFPGGQPPTAASVALAEAIAEVSDYPYPPLLNGCDYSGQLIDWAALQGVPAVDVELTNHRDTDLEQNLQILRVFLGWQP